MTTPLYYAVKGRHRDAIELLIELGADINKRYNEDDCSVVWYACWNKKHTIRRLVELGLDVSISDAHYGPILIRAIKDNNINMVKILLANGAIIDSNCRDHLPWSHCRRGYDTRELVRDFHCGFISRNDLYREVYGCPPCHT